MRSFFKSIFITITILALTGVISFAQENQGRKSMDPAKIKLLEEASEKALEDVKKLNKYAEKLVAFRQANEKAYGFPSELEKLQKMHEATKSFEDDELEEIIDYYESIKEKYNAMSANDLNVAVRKVIDPFQDSGKMSVPWSANTLEQDLTWFKEFKPELERKLEKAEEQAEQTAAEQNKAKQLSDFPEDTYNDGDLADLKQQMLKALLNSVIKTTDEVTGIAIISDWVEGKYTDSKQLYRKISGCVLFADNDNDGISRFTSYVFIANKVDGDWQKLKIKSFCNGCPEGWADAGSGSMAASGSGFLGTLLWFVLAVSNILAGLIAGKELLKKYVPAIEKITVFLGPYSIQIGLVALGAGIASFVISVLSLKIFTGIIPQATAVVLGFILAYDYIKTNATGKLKDQIENSQEAINKVSIYSQTIGLAGLIVGVLYFITHGSIYFL